MGEDRVRTPRPGSSWDLALMVATVLLLSALGAQSLAGTLYSWWAQRAIEGWTQRAGGIAYLTEGHGRRLGSALLHLGFIVSALVVVALQDSPLLLPAFFLGAILLGGGSAMSFYSKG